MLEHTFETYQNPKRVVILGAGGFIGKKLASALEGRGISIKLITRQDLDLAQEGASAALENLLEEGDSIVFLSAITPDKGKDINCFMKNCRMGQTVCESLQKVLPAHLVYFSSDAVYPMTSEIMNESSLAAPEDLYGVMHRAREIMMQSIKVPLAIIRPTIIFGAGDTHNSYGPNRFIREALEKGTITLFGEGEEKRSHVFIDDVIATTMEILCKRSIGIINLATNASIAFKQIAENIKSKVNDDISIICTSRSNGITHRYFDVSYLYKAFPSLTFNSLEQALEISISKMNPAHAPS